MTSADVDAICVGHGRELPAQIWQLLTRGNPSTLVSVTSNSDHDMSHRSRSSGKTASETVNLRQVRRVISNVYHRRDNLAQTLTNANLIAESLTGTAAIFLRVLVLFGILWTLEVDVNGLWISFSSSLLALAFVFGGVMREYFEAAVFLFSVHPYDVGDWITIGELWHPSAACPRRAPCLVCGLMLSPLLRLQKAAGIACDASSSSIRYSKE